MDRIRPSLSRAGWMAGLGVFLTLVWFDLARTYPTFPATLNLQLTLPEGVAGRSEPLVATGRVGAGDFLFITFQGPRTAVFTYDSNGRGLVSKTVTYVPGAAYPLVLEMPAIAAAGTVPSKPTKTLRFNLAGQAVLAGEVPFSRCDPARVFLGKNPVGGTTLGTLFHGEFATTGGERLRGRLDPLIPRGARAKAWVATKLWHVLPIALVGLGGAWIVGRWSRRLTGATAGAQAARGALRCHAAFLAAMAVNVTVFVWLMTNGTFEMVYPDAGGAIFDFQAKNLLQGRLDVPAGTLGGEAFIVKGKTYGYFGPTPALLRLPLIAGNLGFGHLTRPFLVGEYAFALLAAYSILWHFIRIVRGAESRPSVWATVLMMSAAGLGSTLLFLGNRAYVYNEAILCGAAFALWSGYFSLRHLAQPSMRSAFAAAICGVLAVQARPPAGLFALALLGFVALLQLVAARQQVAAWRRPILVGLMACVGFLTQPAVAYLKFGTTDGAPLKYHVQYTPERLAKIDGKNFHLSNVPRNLDLYILRPAFTAQRQFPFFIFDLKRREYPGAKIDLDEWIVGIIYAMAGLVVLAAGAVFGALKIPRLRSPLLAIALASVPLVGCLLMFVATSHRYTADFCGPLILAAAAGLAFFDGQSTFQRRVLFAVATAATLFAAALTLGLAFHNQVDLVWDVSEEVKAHFLHLREQTGRWFGVTGH